MGYMRERRERRERGGLERRATGEGEGGGREGRMRE